VIVAWELWLTCCGLCFDASAIVTAQLYIKGEFVGGSDILMGLHQSGDLKALLSDGPEEAKN